MTCGLAPSAEGNSSDLPAEGQYQIFDNWDEPLADKHFVDKATPCLRS